MIPLINGESYSWSQVVLNILNVPIAGVVSIEYSDNQEMEDHHGAGIYPVSRGFGKYTATGKIVLLMEEVEALTAAVPGGRLQSIPEFDAIVSFLPSNNLPVTHKLRNVRIKNNGRPMKTGDMKIEVELDLQVSHIEWV